MIEAVGLTKRYGTLEAVRDVSFVVVISLTDNRTFSILFGARRADGSYPCMQEQGKYVYTVPESRLREILVGEEVLMPGSP